MKAIGGHPFRAQKLAEQASAWSVEELEDALEGVQDLDAMVKGAPDAGSTDRQRRLAFVLWIEERIAPQTPLKDVAGMLRSFDYAARQLLTTGDAAAAGARPGAEDRATAWAARNQRAYLEGYADVAGADLLADPIPLTAFVLDKAVYEVVYETRNRPDWVDVPLGAIRRLLAGPVLGDVLAGGRS